MFLHPSSVRYSGLTPNLISIPRRFFETNPSNRLARTARFARRSIPLLPLKILRLARSYFFRPRFLRALSGQVRSSIFPPLYFSGSSSRRLFVSSPQWLVRSRFSSWLFSAQSRITSPDLGLSPDDFTDLVRGLGRSTEYRFGRVRGYRPLYVLPTLSHLQDFYSFHMSFAIFAGHSILRRAYRDDLPHELIFKFNRHRLSIALLDPFLRRNHFSLTPGLLIKYLEGKRKGAKKSLSVKLLLVRFLRKILIVSRVGSLALIMKGVPLHGLQLFSFLNKPLSHIIRDPITRKPIDETGDDYKKFSYQALHFLKPKPYGYQKTRKRGRVKRKIRRKIISAARVIDEL